jgi:SAM-dependent methyltransferase
VFVTVFGELTFPFAHYHYSRSASSAYSLHRSNQPSSAARSFLSLLLLLSQVPAVTMIAPTSKNNVSPFDTLALAPSAMPQEHGSITPHSPSSADDEVTSPNSLDRLCQNKYYAFQELGERKVWYSKSAKAYNDCRPKYPDPLIDEVVADHIEGNRILEIGSGPGTATVPLAQRGYKLDCFEPNPDFCNLAQENTEAFRSNVRIHNAAFEEAATTGLEYDAVVAATCMHWIPAEIGFPKAAASLRTGGTLVLLWNMMLTPKSRADFERIKAAHQPNCNDLLVWSDEETQKEVATMVGQRMMESGLFSNFRSREMRRSVTYTTSQYLGLLSTYSQYIRLSADVKSILFERIRKVIDEELGGKLELSYLSMYHVATKKN